MLEKVRLSKSIGINFSVWKLFVDECLSTLFQDMCPFLRPRCIWPVQYVSWFLLFIFRIPPVDAISELIGKKSWKPQTRKLTVLYETQPSSIFHRFRNFSTVTHPIRTRFSVSPKSTLWFSPPSPAHSLHDALTTVSSCLKKSFVWLKSRSG